MKKTEKNNTMNSKIEALLNYIYEEAFYVDTYVEPDGRYVIFLLEMYKLIKKKQCDDMYCQIMKLYISRCIVKNKTMTLDSLLDDLDYFEGKFKIKKRELNKIKSIINGPQKSLKLD